MKARNEFRLSAKQLAAKPHHYTACGLDDVYLFNGFKIEEGDYGRGVAVERLDDLHKAIALHIVAHRKRLSARQFKFLRKQMNATQNEMAKILGVDAQTIARYEKAETAISGPADHLVRFMYVYSQLPEREKRAAIERIRQLIETDDPSSAHPATFRSTRSGWLEAAA